MTRFIFCKLLVHVIMLEVTTQGFTLYAGLVFPFILKKTQGKASETLMRHILWLPLKRTKHLHIAKNNMVRMFVSRLN